MKFMDLLNGIASGLNQMESSYVRNNSSSLRQSLRNASDAELQRKYASLDPSSPVYRLVEEEMRRRGL